MGTHFQNARCDAFPSAILYQPQWFAVHTCSRHEKQVAQHCSARKIEYFLPVYEEVHRWSDRRVSVEAPLFPGYLFARVSLQERLSVLTIPGVAQLVGFGGVPAVMEDGEIETLKRGISGGVRIEPHPYLKVGSRVRVCGGPMRGVEGVLVKKKDGMRVVMSIELIMRSVAVEIDPADLKVIS